MPLMRCLVVTLMVLGGSAFAQATADAGTPRAKAARAPVKALGSGKDDEPEAAAPGQPRAQASPARATDDADRGLLKGLLDRGTVLVTTSNMPPSQLYEGGLQRERFLPAIALLESRLDVIRIGQGPDWRLQRLSDSMTWFDAAQPHTVERMTALFERLAAGSQSEGSQVLDVEGRELQARRTASGMAWFDFPALCEGPRAAADYITLAEELHTLFLSGVPVFDAQRDDAARRFIGLVDELYDRRVKLVASAWAAPQELYRGERLRGAFERTASRLVEMRGRDYLARERR